MFVHFIAYNAVVKDGKGKPVSGDILKDLKVVFEILFKGKILREISAVTPYKKGTAKGAYYR